MRGERGALRIENGVWATLTPAMLIRTSDAVKGMCRFLPSQAGSATLERTMSESETRTSGAKSKPPATSADGAAPSEAEAKAAVEPLTFREKLEGGRVIGLVGGGPAARRGAREGVQGARATEGGGVGGVHVRGSATGRSPGEP